MRTYQYRKANAFTAGGSRGNPAAYLILGGEKLRADEMLSIAREHAGFVSEVVFVSDSEIADMKLTYYSAEREVAFCGHGTVATLCDMLARDENLRKISALAIETNMKGVITARNLPEGVFISAPAPRVLTPPTTALAAAEALGAAARTFDTVEARGETTEARGAAARTLDTVEVRGAATGMFDTVEARGATTEARGAAMGTLDTVEARGAAAGDMPIGFIDAGLRTLIVNIADVGALVGLAPDERRLKAFCVENDIDIALVFSMRVKSDRIAHTRVFAPRFGYLEDPATGSGNAAFAKYLLDHKLWDGSPAVISQGARKPYNAVNIAVIDGVIHFGGCATTKIEGVYRMDEVL